MDSTAGIRSWLDKQGHHVKKPRLFIVCKQQ